MARLSQRRAQRKGSGGVSQRPFRRLRNPYPPVMVLSEDQIESIHDTSLRILEEIGLQFLDDEAISILRQHGASIDAETRMARLDRGLVLERLRSVPSEIALEARNRERNVVLGGNAICFSSVAGPPNCSDLDRGRRPGTLADLQDLLKLAQSLNAIHLLAGAPVAAFWRSAATANRKAPPPSRSAPGQGLARPVRVTWPTSVNTSARTGSGGVPIRSGGGESDRRRISTRATSPGQTSDYRCRGARAPSVWCPSRLRVSDGQICYPPETPLIGAAWSRRPGVGGDPETRGSVWMW